MCAAVWVLLSAALPQTAWSAEDAAALRVAVFPVQARMGIHADLAELVNEQVLQEMRRAGAFGQVISPVEIAQLMPANEQKTVMECASDECALIDNELAGALGASHILVGTVVKLEQTFVLGLKLFDLKRALVVATVSHKVASEAAERLLDAVRPAVSKVLLLASLNKFPTAAVFPLGARLGASPAAAERFTAAVVEELNTWPAFDAAIGPSEVALVMTPDQQNVVTSCAGDECSVIDEDMVGGLGATHVLVGTVARGDLGHVVTLKLIEVKTGVAVSSVTERAGMDEAMLLKAVRPTVIRLLLQGKLMTEAAVQERALVTEARSGSVLPLWTVAGVAGAVAGVSLVVFVGALAGIGAGAALQLPANHRQLPAMELRTKAVVLQSPLVASVLVALAAVVISQVALGVAGVGAILAVRGGP